jgi:hypothetical protein
MSGIARHHSEWLSLIEVSGPFLTLPVLVRVFPQGLPKVDGKKLGRLRAAYEEWANAQDAKAPDASALHATWLRLVLGELLEFDEQTLRSGDGLPSGLDVPLAEHHETLRPSMAIVEPSGRTKAGTPRLLVAVWPSNQDLESAVPAARWAASPLERMTQLCRSTGVRVGLVTNGERWTVVDAPVGQTAGYASWYVSLWLQEPITLAAFDALLGVRRFFSVADTDTIEALLDESVAFQQEVTDQLGYQVRRAVEVLVQALDRADLDRNRELLRDVPPARLYDAALTVMMRLVFLFCAEERGLLLLGDETYDANYAISTLRALLREEADRVGVEVLERRQDAWARLLATFRAVHGGVEHEALRLPALGGSLFDPDRFPFLEGRAVGTSWLATPASPLPIDNRTVLHLLEALQLLRTRGDGGTSEARKLSYRALDIEQIGHVYEGLLDHAAVRVDTYTLGLLGTKDKEPELSLDELNRERRHGADGLIGFLKEHTGRSTSALRNDLDAELEEVAEQRLLVACGNDKALVKHIAPYHALIRKDVWGYPQIYPAGSFMVTGGSERRQTGTHYTPKSLTEQIVTETLEPLVYVGPAEGKQRDAWKLRSAAELLDLKICDMAMGSGAFLVQVCRWLAERVVEAWEGAERQGAAISADGEVLEKAAGHDLLPPDREERLSFARRLVAERCIYGVDINPMAVELAKLSLWLVTLAKGRPFGFLDHNLRSGDSLLGITGIEQLENFHLDPARGRSLHNTLFDPRHEIRRAVRTALELRQRLRATRILDIEDVRRMARMNGEALESLRQPELAADLLVGAVISTAGQRHEALDERLVGLAASLKLELSSGADAQQFEGRAREFLDTDCPERLRPRRPFHWVTEFPEVFVRPDSGFDGIVGNPPFLGGKRLSQVCGDAYNAYLKAVTSESKGAADLSAYFFRRAFDLIGHGGSFGLLATNTIAQADTKEVGLDVIVAKGGTIYSATPLVIWPGTANVHASIVHVSKREWRGHRRLDGHSVASISSRLVEEAGADIQPYRLKEVFPKASGGTGLLGIGFVISGDLFKEWTTEDINYREVLWPYVNGKELNSMSSISPPRYVINFGNMTEEEAEEYPLAMRRVRELVKPQRDPLTRQIHEVCYWKHWDKREALYEAIQDLKRVLVCSFVSKHLPFTFLPTGWVYSKELVVIPTDDAANFALLQSTVHAVWARHLSGTLKSDLSYSISDALRTFPIPDDDLTECRKVGEAYFRARTELLRSLNIGLTDLYNRFHDPKEHAAALQELRGLHKRLDEAVTCAYGWSDLKLQHEFREAAFLPGKDRVRFTISEPARIELLRRLAELNHARYQEEVARGLHGGSATRPPARTPSRHRANSADFAHPELDFNDPSADQGQKRVASKPQAGKDRDPARVILDYLNARRAWYGKAEILSATGLTDGQWNTAVSDLVAHGLVERQGEKRGAKYRAHAGSKGS